MRRAPASMQLTTSNLISSFSSHFREFDLERGPAFWSRDDYVEYLESFAEHFDLIDRIRFSTRVTKVQRSGDTGKWTVTWHRNNGAGQEILDE